MQEPGEFWAGADEFLCLAHLYTQVYQALMRQSKKMDERITCIRMAVSDSSSCDVLKTDLTLKNTCCRMTRYNPVFLICSTVAEFNPQVELNRLGAFCICMQTRIEAKLY